jgi:lysophospholipase L1-like esterase
MRRLDLYGTSILDGHGASTPDNAIGAILQRLTGWTIHNYSRYGLMMSCVQSAAMNALTWATPPGEVIYFAVGTNDYANNAPLAAFQSQYVTALTQMQRATPAPFTGPIIIITETPIWRQGEAVPNGLGLVLEDYRTAIRTASAGLATVVEGPMLVPHDLAYFVDGLHPNDAGHAAYAAALAPALGAVVNR